MTATATPADIARHLAADHAADPLVDAAGCSPADADVFDRGVLEQALAEAGLPSSAGDAEVLRELLRGELAALAD